MSHSLRGNTIASIRTRGGSAAGCIVAKEDEAVRSALTGAQPRPGCPIDLAGRVAVQHNDHLGSYSSNEIVIHSPGHTNGQFDIRHAAALPMCLSSFWACVEGDSGSLMYPAISHGVSRLGGFGVAWLAWTALAFAWGFPSRVKHRTTPLGEESISAD